MLHAHLTASAAGAGPSHALAVDLAEGEVLVKGSEYVIDYAAPVGPSPRVFYARSTRRPATRLVAKVWAKPHASASDAAALDSERAILGMVSSLGPGGGSIQVTGFAEDASVAALIFPFCDGGDLLEYVQRRGAPGDEGSVRGIFVQIVDAVLALHRTLGIAHLDLKLENMLVSYAPDCGPSQRASADQAGDFTVTLIDFGMSVVCESTAARMELHCGSPSYLSPEMLRKAPVDPLASDIWSLGVVFYTLLTGKFPFTRTKTGSLKSLFRAIKRGKFALPDDLSPEAQDLLGSMLVVDASQRPTIEQVKTHPWMQQL